jgi:hypothetical protein
MRTTFRRALGGLLGLGIVTTAAAPARASDGLGSFFATVVAVVVIPDIVFASYGITVAAKGQLPSSGWSIAETVWTVPQTITGNLLYSELGRHQGDDTALQTILLLPTIGVSILSTHGIWSSATTNVRPSVLAWSSVAVGADVALTTGILSSSRHGKLSGRPIGITTMLFTAPQVAAASYFAATKPAPDRAGWIALSAWSGTLFLHGLISTLAGGETREDQPEDAPPAPPPPPPVRMTPSQPVRPVPDNRPPLMVPESLRVGPTIVTDGVATALGIGVGGVLF